MGQRILGEVKERMNVRVECIFPLRPVDVVSNFGVSVNHPCINDPRRVVPALTLPDR